MIDLLTIMGCSTLVYSYINHVPPPPQSCFGDVLRVANTRKIWCIGNIVAFRSERFNGHEVCHFA